MLKPRTHLSPANFLYHWINRQVPQCHRSAPQGAVEACQYDGQEVTGSGQRSQADAEAPSGTHTSPPLGGLPENLTQGPRKG